MINGKHLIAGEWIETDSKFKSSPANGQSHEFSVGNSTLVNKAAESAEEAFFSYGNSSRHERAILLKKIAEEIEKRGDDITEIGSQNWTSSRKACW